MGKKDNLGVLTLSSKNSMMTFHQVGKFLSWLIFIMISYFDHLIPKPAIRSWSFLIRWKEMLLSKPCTSSDHLIFPLKSVNAQPVRVLQHHFYARNGQLKSPQTSVLQTSFSCLATWIVAIITSASNDFNTWMASLWSKSGWRGFSVFFSEASANQWEQADKATFKYSASHETNRQWLKAAPDEECENTEGHPQTSDTSFQ